VPDTALMPDQSLRASLTREGYVFVHADAMRRALEAFGPLDDWAAFAASWDDLEVDPYMADGGRYRRRRHAAYLTTAEGAIVRGPAQPHFQALDYNPLNGGVARWFEPVTAAAGAGASMQTVLAFCRALFDQLAGGANPSSPSAAVHWAIEVHQFRIEARSDAEGRPTPEGMHRDGVDYVLVLLVNRRNIASGTTAILGPDGRELGRFTLTQPLDAALVDDARVSHGVTPVQALDASAPAYRDVLVVTFKKTA
jgi:hypothetical protein